MGTLIEILKDAGPSLTLIVLVVALVLIGVLYRRYSAMRESEHNRTAEHLAIMERRIQEIEKVDERRSQSLAAGSERFKQHDDAIQKTRDALMEVSTNFVRTSECEKCQSRQEASHKRTADMLDRLISEVAEGKIAAIKLEQSLTQRMDVMTNLLAKVVKLGGPEVQP